MAEAHANQRDLHIENKVIEKIAALTLNDIPEILSMDGGAGSNLTERLGRKDLTKGLTAEVGKKQAAIDVSVVIKYGSNVPKVYDEAKQKIKENLAQMTGLELVEFTMAVSDIDSEGEGKLGFEKTETREDTEQRVLE